MSLHYLVKYKCKKLTIINSKRVGKQNKHPLWCYTLLNPFIWISGILNDMFVSGLCGLASTLFHPQWSCSLQYSNISVCWSHAFGRCCMFPKSLLITFPLFCCCSLSSKMLSVFSKNCIFEPVQVLNQSLVSTAEWCSTSPVYCQCIKNYYLWQYHLLSFTNIRNACKTRQFNFCMKISKNCFRRWFFAYVL